MMKPGQFYTLTASDMQAQGLYLKDDDGDRVLLPKRQVPEGIEMGDELNVFIYLDSDDRLIATTERPKAQLHQVASLMVKDVNRTGAFLDWGLPKDLFVPFGEQKQRLEEGKNCVVYVTEDNTGRLIGTTRLNRFIKDEARSDWPGAPDPLAQGDKGSLLIAQRTDIGYKAVVNNEFWGVLHESQIHKAIRVGQKMDGYVRRIRDDHRIDLSLEPIGHGRADPLAKKILKKLNDSGGQLGISDHSPADLIELHFGVSKRAFKMAIGKLFKERKIVIEADGIRLAEGKQDQRRSERTPRPAEKSAAPDPYANARQAEAEKPKERARKTVYRNPKSRSDKTLSLSAGKKPK